MKFRTEDILSGSWSRLHGLKGAKAFWSCLRFENGLLAAKCLSAKTVTARETPRWAGTNLVGTAAARSKYLAAEEANNAKAANGAPGAAKKNVLPAGPA